MTETQNTFEVLQSIPRREQERIREGYKNWNYLALSVHTRTKAILSEARAGVAMRRELPRVTDIYRYCVDKGIEILQAMSVEEIRALNEEWKEPMAKKTPCGFDAKPERELGLLRLDTGLRDYQIRRLALKLGFEAVFGAENE